MILKRYLRKEIVMASLGILFVLILIFSLQRFVYYINSAASGRLSTSLIGELLVLQIPRIFSLLLPLSVFLGTMIALGRMYADQEITVMRACGIGQKSMINALLKPGVVLMIVSLIFSFWVTPWAGERQYQLLDKQSAQKDITLLSAGRFQQSVDGKSIVYIQNQLGKGKFSNIFIAKNTSQLFSKKKQNQEITVVSAKSGEILQQQKQRYFMLNAGKSFQGIPGQQNFDVSIFRQYLMHIPNESTRTKTRGYFVIPTSDLIKINDAKSRAEIQWRISIGLSTLLLMLVAIPLARVNPRQGRYAKVGLGLLVYIFYLAAMILSKNWIEHDMVPNYIGLWWSHLSLFVYFLYVSGYFKGNRIFSLMAVKGN